MRFAIVLRRPKENLDGLPGLGIMDEHGRLIAETNEVSCRGNVRLRYELSAPIAANGTLYQAWLEADEMEAT